MEWTPIVFYIFKFLVLGIGMFFAVKWHYDQGKKGKVQDKGAALRGAGKVAAIFVVALLVLGLLTWFVLGRMSLDMRMP